MEVPVGVVASVLVTSPQALTRLPTMTNGEFTDLLRKVWGHWWLEHPHLATMARPITSWLDQPSDHLVTAAKAVAETALRRRIKSYQGLETDILSFVVTGLRSRGARKWLGEFHTPPDVCDTMAAFMLRELPEKGEQVMEPASGTGGLVRAYAHRIKQLGGEPADYLWHMVDIDPISAACSAANALVWNLGAEVYVYCGDTLREAGTFEKAARHRAEALRAWCEVVEDGRSMKRLIDATTAFEKLLNA
ncbi:N-6 DNA methylase [Streptosporangium sp. NPDC000239]|uniref:N-6 DNA methylase n=1 Tax=Streptosporangium sp. NPDC000239 TaxID=3154248 RepID=UPI00332BCD71